MKCPFCLHRVTKVFDSRKNEFAGFEVIKRRRRCQKCFKPFSTFEIREKDLESLA